MNLVFFYTIPHTGTRFLEQFFHANFKDAGCATISFTDHMHQAGILDFDCKYVPLYYKDIAPYVNKFLATENHLNYLTNQVNILRHHRSVPSSKFEQSLHLSEIPVISTIRDPLLSINAHIWRAYGNGWITSWRTLNYDNRFKIADLWIQLFHNVLDESDADRFLFPIDLCTNKTARTSKIINMLEYCQMPLTYSGREYIAEWKPFGLLEQSPQAKKYKLEQDALKAKQAILNKDKKLVSSLLPIIFHKLQEEDELKEKLYNVGYRDLVWW